MPQDLKSHWRDSALVPKFYIFDARAFMALLLVVMHPRYWTIAIFLGLIAMSAILNYFNLPLFVGARIVKNFIAGKKRIIFKYE